MSPLKLFINMIKVNRFRLVGRYDEATDTMRHGWFEWNRFTTFRRQNGKSIRLRLIDPLSVLILVPISTWWNNRQKTTTSKSYVLDQTLLNK